MFFNDTLHSFFFFLGTPAGDLFKRSIELLVFVIIAYMVASEWRHTKKKEYKFLVFAFGLLALQRSIIILLSSPAVFGVAAAVPRLSLSLFKGSTEIIAVFFVAAAFATPAILQHSRQLIPFLKQRVLALGFVSLSISLALFFVRDAFMPEDYAGLLQIGSSVSQIVILAYFVYLVYFGSLKRIPYSANIVLAFMVFAITPLLKLFNILLYDGTNTSLQVASHPFPILAVLLFTRVVYLKLVDKAFLKEELRATQKRYLHEKEVSRLKDEFVSVVSHELRTPLTSMKLYTSLLLDGKLGTLLPKQKKALSVVNTENERLNKLINNVLDLSKLEAGKIEITCTAVNIHALVTNPLYLSTAKDKGIFVKIDVPRDFVVLVDEEKFAQIFINLFNNSIKFTPPKGSISISACKEGMLWKFIIADTGGGVPPDKIQHLFDKFYQADDFMTRKQGGTGLGLAVVKHLVNLHGGRVSVDSEVGRGTTFTIEMPL
ncbi:HAMP domain-containing histidine kinase [Candidatus Woesearchaeota archaeon]|nr:HAMP domain-containing histidine kinase [Candidatus Woesearchaeota archaeon]